MKALSNGLMRLWYGRGIRYWPALCLLWPLSLIFCVIALIRKVILVRQQELLSVPVIVVGNITVGGTGKTPLLSALVVALKNKGLRVGIVSRGYGGTHAKTHMTAPRFVTVQDDAAVVGDEPLLLAQLCNCPVVIGRDRVAAAKLLQAENTVDVILSDDGLQHYALQRCVEVAVIDGARGLGNQCCLPAGPLREPISRLHSVNFIVVNGEPTPSLSEIVSALPVLQVKLQVKLVPQCWVSLYEKKMLPLSELGANQRLHAVAGIGNPSRFFHTLKTMGFEITEHVFPDHHHFVEQDFQFSEDDVVVMTEKDAVKCGAFAKKNWYALRVAVSLPDAWVDDVIKKIENK